MLSRWNVGRVGGWDGGSIGRGRALGGVEHWEGWSSLLKVIFTLYNS